MALERAEIGRRIREIREQSAVSAAQLAAALGTDPATVLQLEAGQLDPVPGDFILIAARVLRTDFRYFISTQLDAVEVSTKRVYRALADPTPAQLVAIRRFVSFCTNEAELEQLLDIQPRALPPTYPTPAHTHLRHKEQGRLAAREERRRFGLGNEPIGNVFEVLRSQGIRLFRQRSDNVDLSGVTVLQPQAGHGGPSKLCWNGLPARPRRG